MNHTIIRIFWLAFLFLATAQSSLAIEKKDFPTIYEKRITDETGNTKTKYGYTTENDLLTDAIFDKAYPFSPNGLALVSYNNHYGFINTKGKYYIEVGLKGAHPFGQFRVTAIKIKTKWGLINDKDNVWVLKDIFDEIDNFQPNGLAIVKYEKKYGLVDTLGNVVLPVIYDKIEKFDKSGYAYIKSGNKFGVVDKRGRAIVQPDYKDKKSALAAISDRPKFGSLKETLLADNSTQNNKKEEEEKKQKLLAEQKQKEEEAKILAAQKRLEEENKRLAEQKQKEAEEQERLLAEQNLRQEEEIRRQAEARKRLDETPTLNNYIAANLGSWNDYLAAQNINIPSDEEIRSFIEEEVSKWQIKGEFEPTAKWKERVNETTRTAKINAMADSIFSVNSKNVEAVRAEYRKKYEELVDKYCAGIAEQFASQNLEIKPYDADNETFLISTTDFGDFLLPVPLDEAPGFKQEWDNWKSAAIASFMPNGDDVVLKSVSIGKYKYDSDMDATYAQVDVDYNFKPVDVAQLSSRLDEGDNLAMNSANSGSANQNKGFQTTKVKISAGSTPDTDLNIPVGKPSDIPTFAVVIANGNYDHASKVDHAENDGRIMAQYLTRTLGIPESNVATFINATYGQMASAISMLQDVGDAYNGSDFNIIFYYVGHGLPDDEGKKSYILPVDIDPRQVSICMPLEKIYADLGNMGAKNVTVMVDACFSGTNHGEGMLIPQSMGVALKPKKADPVGNMIVLAATEGNETAFPYEEKGHGLFTYWILKKLQETSGQVTFGELSDYVIDNVKKTSVTVNKKPQTPTVATTPQLTNSWRNLKFGN
ncbi:MAG: WG repeat-containing protein [Muribaculaceae bacterium]|nr:WG repeat-containing protein [Muribaculaceae bacterium]